MPFAVVTGAGSGIGRASAIRLAREGFEVCVLDRSADAVAAAASAVSEAGRAVVPGVADVSDRAAVDAALAGVASVDLLVNNAGVFFEKPFEELTDEDFRRTYDINVIGAVNVTQACLPRMPDRSRIINIASRAYLGTRNQAHYVATKAALVSLTRTLAQELSPRAIAVNAIAPGMVLTGLFDGYSKDAVARFASHYPRGEVATPEDIAQVVAFFAAPQTRFITGQTLIVDGGRSVGVAPA
ncbi:MAG TPA: SDR family oxidoreductase [Phenylobacterium sp.]|nr:SDR family oxidoreductase [Phenylobacterium sp.]